MGPTAACNSACHNSHRHPPGHLESQTGRPLRHSRATFIPHPSDDIGFCSPAPRRTAEPIFLPPSAQRKGKVYANRISRYMAQEAGWFLPRTQPPHLRPGHKKQAERRPPARAAVVGPRASHRTDGQTHSLRGRSRRCMGRLALLLDLHDRVRSHAGQLWWASRPGTTTPVPHAITEGKRTSSARQAQQGRCPATGYAI